jgi:hypothetical protein
MEIKFHDIKNIKIAEILSDETVINSAEEALDLVGNIYYQGADGLIIHENNITPEFFDLKNGIAGEILQKFSNYRVRLAIIGSFEKYSGKSLRDFIYESNKNKHINFVNSLSDAIRIISA